MSESIISGTVITSLVDAERIGIKVQALDRDLPSLERRMGYAPQVLGEATADADGRFQITYTLEQFQLGDGTSTVRRTRDKNAHISFRAFDRTGQELAIKGIEALHREYRSDEIIFNVPNPISVSIVVEPVRDAAGTSEYEQLIAQLAPIVQDVPLRDLSDEDIAFLTNEVGIEQQRDVQQRIEWLRRCALLAQQTGLPIDPFYGWGRKNLPASLPELSAVPLRDLPAVLERLIGLRADRLRDALSAAIVENIIPAALGDRVDEIVRQFTRGVLQLIQLRARLWDDATGMPLAGHSVTTVDKDNHDENLGLDIVACRQTWPANLGQFTLILLFLLSS